MLNDPWQLLLAFGVVGLLSFILGARWMRRELTSREEKSLPPITTGESVAQSDILNNLDRVSSELSALAERQEFAERLLMQRKHLESSAPGQRGRVVTPV